MELLQLRYFYDSARYESFAKAAQKHMVPTPSVAASVKRLEKELNCMLFDRFANHIALNDNGKKLLTSLSSVFSELDNIPSLLSSSFADNREVKILARAFSYELVNFINKYKQFKPDVKIKISFSELNGDYHKYDLILDEKSDKYPDYVKYDVASTALVLVAKQHPLAEQKISIKDLRRETFIVSAEDSALYSGFIAGCNRMGFTPNVIATYGDTYSYQKSISDGVGIGVGRAQIYYTVSSAMLDVLNVSDFRIPQVISVYYKQQSFYGNVEDFFNFISQKDFIHDKTQVFFS